MKIKSQPATKEYRKRWDEIFKKCKGCEASLAKDNQDYCAKCAAALE